MFCATFYYLCSILDGYSRFLIHWDLRESMTETDIESAIGYITPKDMLAGRPQEIQAERDRKLEAAREQRKNRCQRARVTDETDFRFRSCRPTGN